MHDPRFQKSSPAEARQEPERELEDWQFSELKERPEIVLSVLEPDQLVMAKEKTPFGPRRLAMATRIQLWALRVYVIVMMIVVAVSVYHAIQGAH